MDLSDAFAQRLCGYANMARNLSRDETRDLARIVELVKKYLQEEGRHFVAGAENAPILCSYANDGTPISTHERWVKTWGAQGHRVHRQGSQAH